MRILILKILLFCTLLISLYVVMVHKLSQGYVDMYYPKFTQKAGSLVIGLSRADEGIDPTTFVNEVSDEFNLPMENFASNQNYYGKVYLNAIKNKLNKGEKNGIFILTVSPGSFTGPKGFGTTGIEAMDQKAAIGKTKDFTSEPNYSYIMNCYGNALYTTFFAKDADENPVTHENGWNEISLKTKSFTITKDVIRNWKKQNLAYFERKLTQEEVKPYRLKWFGKTVEHLKDKGGVFLVRMPADKDVIDFENRNSTRFTMLMDSIAKAYQVPYLDYSKNVTNFETYDGSHLFSRSAKEFTVQLAKDISAYLKE